MKIDKILGNFINKKKQNNKLFKKQKISNNIDSMFNKLKSNIKFNTNIKQTKQSLFGNTSKQSLFGNTSKQSLFGKMPKMNTNNINFKNILNKPASNKMQQKWSNYPNIKKKLLRKVLIDSDNDKVPNIYDCQPFNSKKQDDENMDLYKKWIEKSDSIKNAISNLGFNVKLVTIRCAGDEISKFLNDGKYYNIPVDVYASIPLQSSLAIALHNKNEDPRKWWVRWDSDVSTWEILTNGASSYQDSGYSGYCIDSINRTGHITDIVKNNIELVDFDEVF